MQGVQTALNGVKMELEDATYPLLKVCTARFHAYRCKQMLRYKSVLRKSLFLTCCDGTGAGRRLHW